MCSFIYRNKIVDSISEVDNILIDSSLNLSFLIVSYKFLIMKKFSTGTYVELGLNEVACRYYLYDWNATVQKARTDDGEEIWMMAEHHLKLNEMTNLVMYLDYVGCYGDVNANVAGISNEIVIVLLIQLYLMDGIT